MKKIIFIILIVSFGLFLIQNSRAQLILPTTLSLKTVPVTPLPNSTAVATAILSGSDTTNAAYTWSLNNVRQSDSSGTDKNTFSFPTGKLGSIYTVSVSVTTSIGENLRDSVSFTVSDADLTWSAQNQAPADYEGKILPSDGTKMIVSALPIIFSPGTKTQLNPNNLNYRWFLNNIFDSSGSGLGKSTYKYTAGANGDNLKVLISNAQNTAMVEKPVVIPTVAPKVLVFLADSAGSITYRSAIATLVTNLGQKLTFKAVPYFFNLLPSQLNWSWFVNDKKIEGAPQNPWLATFTIPANLVAGATFRIIAGVDNPFFTLENASVSINITAQSQ